MIARYVDPTRLWKVVDGVVFELGSDGTRYVYEPFKETERGQSQLLQIIFALLADGCLFDLTYEEVSHGTGSFTASVKGVDYDYVGNTRAEVIINLAYARLITVEFIFGERV